MKQLSRTVKIDLRPWLLNNLVGLATSYGYKCLATKIDIDGTFGINLKRPFQEEEKILQKNRPFAVVSKVIIKAQLSKLRYSNCIAKVSRLFRPRLCRRTQTTTTFSKLIFFLNFLPFFSVLRFTFSRFDFLAELIFQNFYCSIFADNVLKNRFDLSKFGLSVYNKIDRLKNRVTLTVYLIGKTSRDN